jgi:predicted transcriptional regulator
MAAVITHLRDLVPIRPLTYPEALRVAELQATTFLRLSGLDGPPVPETAISELPRVQVERMFPAVMAGGAQWSLGRWLIVLNGANATGRQRFSLAHEFKHILDHPFIPVLYPPVGAMSSHEREEQVCDFFAACLLMPRPWLKRVWASGSQDLRALARRFEVSKQAMQVRLEQIGLAEPQPRCLTPEVA